MHFAADDRGVAGAKIATSTNPARGFSLFALWSLRAVEPRFDIETARAHQRTHGECAPCQKQYIVAVRFRAQTGESTHQRYGQEKHPGTDHPVSELRRHTAT